MILAELKDYVKPEHLLIVMGMLLVYVPAAFVIGGLILHKSLAKFPEARKLRKGRCMLAVFLALAGASGVGAITAFLVYTIGQRMETVLLATSAIVGATMWLVTFVTVLFVMFNFSLKQLLPGMIKTTAFVGVITVAIWGTAGINAYRGRVNDFTHAVCQYRLRCVYAALDSESQNFRKALPQDLDFMLEVGKDGAPKYNPGLAKCECRPDLKIGFFYHSPGSAAMVAGSADGAALAKKPVAAAIVACDFKGSHPDGRAVLTTDKVTKWMTEKDFQEALKKPANAQFAKALAEVEK